MMSLCKMLLLCFKWCVVEGENLGVVVRLLLFELLSGTLRRVNRTSASIRGHCGHLLGEGGVSSCSMATRYSFITQSSLLLNHHITRIGANGVSTLVIVGFVIVTLLGGALVFLNCCCRRLENSVLLRGIDSSMISHCFVERQLPILFELIHCATAVLLHPALHLSLR